MAPAYARELMYQMTSEAEQMVCLVHPIQKRQQGVYLYSLKEGERFPGEGPKPHGAV